MGAPEEAPAEQQEEKTSVNIDDVNLRTFRGPELVARLKNARGVVSYSSYSSNPLVKKILLKINAAVGGPISVVQSGGVAGTVSKAAASEDEEARKKQKKKEMILIGLMIAAIIYRFVLYDPRK